jgi:type IV secretory pathway VirD2 relaxase
MKNCGKCRNPQTNPSTTLAGARPRRFVRRGRAHGRYIARESAAAGSPAIGFDQNQHGVDVPSTLERWQAAQDTRLWKIIVSPEFGERLDPTRLTRDLMGRMEKDLHTQLEWVAVAHFNAEHPHVHVALRVTSLSQMLRPFARP